MRPAPRYFAVDDGHFTFEDDEAALVGVLTRGAATVEAVTVGRVAVDGLDAPERVVELVRRLPGAGPDILLTDGVALGGFNILDLAHLHEATGMPVVAVTRRRPDRARMESAIRERLSEPEVRLGRLPKREATEVEVVGKRLYVHVEGTRDDLGTIQALLGPAMGEGGIPEPLRLAHLVATAVTRGVSGTKA
ncbi:MAG: DUF99 family protein [Euryarchaeota archaeon]|nr:DUF99 family protein [Euryarchaeota archaeon]